MASEPREKSLLLRALGCLGIFVVLFMCLICGTSYWAYNNWTTMPEWWTHNQESMSEMDVAELDQMAESVEKRLINEVGGDVEATSPRTITVSMEEATAWMRQRLPQWLESAGQELPKEFQQMMVASDNGLLVLAFYHSEAKQVFSILLDVEINDNEMLEVKLEEVRGGSMSLPVETFVQMLESQPNSAPGGSAADARLLMDGLELSPVFQLPGQSGRLMRVKAIDVQSDAIKLTVEPAQSLNPTESRTEPEPE